MSNGAVITLTIPSNILPIPSPINPRSNVNIPFIISNRPLNESNNPSRASFTFLVIDSANLSNPSKSKIKDNAPVTKRISPPTNPSTTPIIPSLIPPMIPSSLYPFIKPVTKSNTPMRIVIGKNILPRVLPIVAAKPVTAEKPGKTLIIFDAPVVTLPIISTTGLKKILILPTN